MEELRCNYCGSKIKKNGFQKNGRQRYKCLSQNCNKQMQQTYIYLAKSPDTWELFKRLRKVNVPIRKMASEVLFINRKTLTKWILRANKITPKYLFSPGCNYEIDELHTYIGCKKNKVCVCFGWNRAEGKPLGLHVGGWSTEELLQVGKKVISFNPKKVYTDGLKQYKIIFKDVLHKAGRNITNHIERQNLNLRKDVSFLSRKTICFARTKAMLKARVMWYFWGDQNPLFFLNSRY